MDASAPSDGGDGISKSRSSSFSIVSASDFPKPDVAQELLRETMKSVPELQAWLQPTEYLSPGNEYMKHVAAHVPGTGDWLRNTDEFGHWLDESSEHAKSGSLWIKGVPGTGKSVVAASTAQSLQKTGDPVLFFFFRQIVNTNHTPIYLIRDWCAQLLPHDRTFQREISDLSEHQTPGGIELTVLWEALCSAFKRLSKVFCIADALDEMDEAYWDSFIPLLKSLPSASKGLKLLLTSRPIPRLEALLQDPNMGKIRLDPMLLYPDIITYTNVRLLALPEPVRLTTEKEDRVRDAICERASGLFLQARLMIDNLTTGLLKGTVTDETLPDSLERLPRSLRELYISMLDEHSRRSGVSQEQQFKVLTCVISSSRPLRLIELASMMCWMRGDKPDEDLKEYKELVRASCGRLLEILEDETVSVIHHSFTEFLRDENRADSAFPIVGALEAQKTLAVLCLDYLSACVLPDVVSRIFEKAEVEENKKEHGSEEAHGSEEEHESDPKSENDPKSESDEEGDDEDSWAPSDFEIKEIDELTKNEVETALTRLRLQYPLLEYAVTNLVHHLRLANGKELLQEDIAERLDALFKPGSAAFAIFLLRHWRSKAFTKVTPLHVATAMEFEPYVLHLISHGADLDAEDNGGRTSLLIACDTGPGYDDAFTRIAEVLLDAKANPDLPDGTGKKPLHYAVEKVRPGIVRLLLKAGVSPTTPRTRNDRYYMNHFYQSTKGDTPLLSSTFGMESLPRTEIMTMFLPYLQHDTELLYKMLAWTTEFEVIQKILELGKGQLDANMLLDGFTLLYRAAGTQNVKLVKLLLQHGADPKVRCEDNRLYSLARHEHVSIRPAGQEDSGPSALHAWADEERERRGASTDDIAETFRLMIEAGADVNATTEKELRTPLHEAVEEPYGWSGMGFVEEKDETRARILLEAGADPNRHDKYGHRTPLHAVKPNWNGLIDIFVDNGADVNAKNRHGDTPLRTLLIRDRATLGSGSYWSDGLLTAARLLLKNGADVNTKDNAGNTIGHRMIGLLKDKTCDRKKLLELWRVFLDAGLELNARNNAGQTPYLLYQTGEFGKCEADLELFDALKELGMVQEQTLEEKTKLLFNVVNHYNPSYDRLKELIDQGYPVNVRNGLHKTLLHVAVAQDPYKSKRIIKLLLDHGADPSTMDFDENTLMHAFASRGGMSPSAVGVFKMLLSHGVPPGTKNKAGQLPLHLAAAYGDDISEGHTGNVRTTLNLMLATTNSEIDAADGQGLRPIHYAASISERFVDQLLEAGADARVLTHEGVSPLHVACRARESNTVGLLLTDYLRHDVLGEWINKKEDIDGRTPLHVAARSGQEESVRYLLEHGADVSAIDSTGCTALHAVAELYEEVALWKENGGKKGLDAAGIPVIDSCSCIIALLIAAEVNQDAKNARGLNALEYAKEKKNDKMVAVLKEMNCSGGMQTPVDEVFDKLEDIWKFRDADILRILQSGKYDVTDPLDEWRNSTVLHKLVSHGKVTILNHFPAEVQKLHTLDYMSEEDNPGTLLMEVCERTLPSLHILRTLVGNLGLDVNEKSNRRGYTYKISKAAPLHRLAAGTNFWNIEAARYLINKGADIEATNGSGATPLAAAVSDVWPDGYWKKATAKLLLEAGANPNSVDELRETPLCKATSVEVVQLLLNYGADIHAGNPLYHAIQRRNFEVAQKLLNCGADPNRVDLLHDVAAPSERWTDDEEDIEEGKAEKRGFTELLLQYHADPFAQHEGSTVLHTLIEEHGILDPFWQVEGLDLERRGTEGRTLLISACVPTVPLQPSWPIKPTPTACGSPEVALTLIARGATVDSTDSLGRTALHWLCMHPGDFDSAHQTVFDALVEKSPSLINKADVEGQTPFHLATAYLHEWTVDRLVSLGADSTTPDLDGSTPLHHFASAMFGAKEKAIRASNRFRHLLTQGYDINAKNTAGETPLFRFCAARLSNLPPYVIAGQQNQSSPYDSDEVAEDCPFPLYNKQQGDISHSAALRVFVEAGADLHTTNDVGETVLHATASRRSDGGQYSGHHNADWDQREDVIETFKALVDRGVDPKREDIRHRTAVDVAVACGYTGIVDLFAPEKKLAA